jgi:hypothetical protein
MKMLVHLQAGPWESGRNNVSNSKGGAAPVPLHKDYD